MKYVPIKNNPFNIIINNTINLVFKTAISILVISNHNSFRVLFGKMASVYFIWKIYLYFSVGKCQPREPALCQLYRHTFVPYIAYRCTSREHECRFARPCLRPVTTASVECAPVLSAASSAPDQWFGDENRGNLTCLSLWIFTGRLFPLSSLSLVCNGA